MPPTEGCRLPPTSSSSSCFQLTHIDLDAGDLLPLLHGHYPASSLLRSSPPLACALVLSASRLVGLSGQAGSDHAAVECIERRQERRRAVALVVVRHRLAASLLERQAGRSAIESLELRFFVAAEDQRVFGWRAVESDDIVEFFGETGVVAELESMDAMRLLFRSRTLQVQPSPLGATKKVASTS